MSSFEDLESRKQPFLEDHANCEHVMIAYNDAQFWKVMLALLSLYLLVASGVNLMVWFMNVSFSLESILILVVAGAGIVQALVGILAAMGMSTHLLILYFMITLPLALLDCICYDVNNDLLAKLGESELFIFTLEIVFVYCVCLAVGYRLYVALQESDPSKYQHLV